MKRSTFLLLIFCLLVSIGCGKKTPAEQPSKQPIVLVSSPPYIYFTKLIAGTTVDVECLTPPGTNPHLFEVPPKQVQKILQSSLWLRLGEPMEEKFLDIFRTHNPGLRILDLSEGIALIDLPHLHHEGPCHHDGQDRHFWTSPSVAKQQLVKIAETLAAMFPEYESVYRANLSAGLEQLTDLDQEIHALLTTTRPDAIVISHPALGYFCRDYGIEQLSIETEGKEPLPADLASLVEKIQDKKVSSILLLPQHNNQGAIRMADILHLPVYVIDPYSPDYPTAIRSTALAIARSSPTPFTP